MITYQKVEGDFNLQGQVAIVVGGAGGIGEATARMYASHGAKVVITSRRKSCPQLADDLREKMGETD